MVSKFKSFKKSSQRTVFSSILIWVLLLAVIGFLIFSNLKISQKRAELSAKIEDLTKEIQILEEKNQELQAGIAKTGSESYWEERIREQGFVKEGEKAVVVKPPKESQGDEMVEAQSFLEKLAELVEKIKNFFARVIQW